MRPSSIRGPLSIQELVPREANTPLHIVGVLLSQERVHVNMASYLPQSLHRLPVSLTILYTTFS
jgi:hypothetical protein